MKKGTLLTTLIGMTAGLNNMGVDMNLPTDISYSASSSKPYYAGREKRNSRRKMIRKSRRFNRGQR